MKCSCGKIFDFLQNLGDWTHYKYINFNTYFVFQKFIFEARTYELMFVVRVENRTKTERAMRSKGERNRAGSTPRCYWRRRLHPRENERIVRPVRSTTTYPRDIESTLDQPFALYLSHLLYAKYWSRNPLSFIWATISCPLWLRSHWNVLHDVRHRNQYWYTKLKIVYYLNSLNLDLKFHLKSEEVRTINLDLSSFSLFHLMIVLSIDCTDFNISVKGVGDTKKYILLFISSFLLFRYIFINNGLFI